jgi:hypothetical protein
VQPPSGAKIPCRAARYPSVVLPTSSGSHRAAKGDLFGLRYNATRPLRSVKATTIFTVVTRAMATLEGEMVIVRYKAAIIGTCAAVAVAAAPLTPASARPHHAWPVFGLAALGAAALVGAATIATAPVRVLAAPFYAPPLAYYPPAPAYYAPPPGYYAPPPGYYGPPSGYYGR